MNDSPATSLTLLQRVQARQPAAWERLVDLYAPLVLHWCRRAGLVLLLYVLIAILFPRIYIGIHYPTDVLAGAVLGAGSVLMLSWSKIRNLWTGYVLNWIERSPAFAYAVLFLVTFEIGTLFWDIRTFLYIFDISV